MSRIYFHSPSETMEIYGRERAWMGCLTDDLARGVIATRGCLDLARFLPAGAYPLSALEPVHGSAPRFADAIGTWTSGHGHNHWLVDAQEYDCWELNLNTCLALGSDPVRLCARLHAQCEIHAYVEGPSRAWLAGIVREGILSGVMRDGGSEREQGQWSRLASWLGSNPDEPVVSSYSVCDQFPSQAVALAAGKWTATSDDGEEWYALPEEERWRLCLEAIRENGPALSPDGWREYRFGKGKDALWLQQKASEAAAAARKK